jgi:SAM-dependent methyltransferase
MIDPRDVMARWTVEELCKTADDYYRRVADPTPLLAKPFWFLHETPAALHNLGLLLGGLRLGKAMTVLDFGAGTCWLSRVFTQLHCKAIACDTSAAALEFGKQLFQALPVLGSETVPPDFLLFDGHRLGLPEASVDRIVCFDAFHHIPNQSEVLQEFGRVLRPGGIAGFSEPGRHHSQAPQSQYEMANYKVLENDIDLNAIFALGQAAGFTRLSVKVVNDMDMSLDDVNTLFGSDRHETLKSTLWNETFNAMHNRAIFFLHKGESVPDSRSHVGLAHELSIDSVEERPGPARAVRVHVTIRNTGPATWLHESSGIFGVVRLGTHLYDAERNLIDVDHSRHFLPRSVAAGESVTLTVDVPLPGHGAYQLGFDMVAEGVSWFENLGSATRYVSVHSR